MSDLDAPHIRRSGEFIVSDCRDRLDRPLVHGWIASTYWSPGIARERFERALEHSSFVGGIYEDRSGNQAGSGRVVSDHVRFAYLMDVFLDPAFRERSS